MKKQNLFLMSIALTGLLFFPSCDKDEDKPSATKDIIQVAQSKSNLSTFVTAVNAAGLTSALKGTGPFTVFAPSNAAFANLDAATLEALLADPAALADLLKYHVVSGEKMSGSLASGAVSTLLSGKSINVTVSGGMVTLNGTSGVETADLDASNGVIHIIDEVLIYPGFEVPKKSIYGLAASTPSLSILKTALDMFPDLKSALDSDGSFTVFAPTNDAFVALLGVTGQAGLSDIPESVIERLLKYHVIAGASLMSTDLTDGQQAATLLSADDKITVGIDGTSVTINGANVTAADVEGSNGIVHIVDAVLVPALELSIVNTIVEPAYFNKNFSILTEAVVKADLLGTLTNPSASLTLFAPDNAAFAAAGITSIAGLTASDLTPILTYHVLGSEVFANALPPTGSAVTTLNGPFYLSINPTGVFINGLTKVTTATISGGALDYTNGVVHLINRTLLPATKNVVEIAVAASQAATGAEFGQLVAALTAVENDPTAANLITILSGTGPFTVFAPTDAAFASLYTLAGVANFDALVTAVGIPTIEAVLKYHVLGARVFSSDLPNLSGNVVATLGGNITLNLGSLTITDTDAALNLGTADATITATDIAGTNGVIHVINQVLLP
ncbi:MAG: fasciclin domain-containing protein [Bacteroidales bacterium]|nr:fasciclin domain-containing protein [Bacteroidales bacterium]